MQKWSAGEPGSAELESCMRANGARPRKGGEREGRRRGKREEERNDRERRHGRMTGDI